MMIGFSKIGAALLIVTTCIQIGAQNLAQAEKTPSCESPELKEFDFMLGEWRAR